jgi:hypothetical protein
MVPSATRPARSEVIRAVMSASRVASVAPVVAVELDALGVGEVVEAIAGIALAPRAIPPTTAVEARTRVSFFFMGVLQGSGGIVSLDVLPEC